MSSALILKDIAFSFNSSIMPPACKEHPARVAQGIEHWIPNPGVARSIRAVGTNKFKVLSRYGLTLFSFRDMPVTCGSGMVVSAISLVCSKIIIEFGRRPSFFPSIDLPPFIVPVQG